MKTLVIALLTAVCGVASAGSYPVPIERSPVITPDIAIGHKSFSYYSVTLEGEMVVCPYYDWYSHSGGTCKDYSGANQWKRLRDVVPKGRTFVGYSIDTYRDNLYVYWK